MWNSDCKFLGGMRKPNSFPIQNFNPCRYQPTKSGVHIIPQGIPIPMIFPIRDCNPCRYQWKESNLGFTYSFSCASSGANQAPISFPFRNVTLAGVNEKNQIHCEPGTHFRQPSQYQSPCFQVLLLPRPLWRNATQSGAVICQQMCDLKRSNNRENHCFQQAEEKHFGVVSCHQIEIIQQRMWAGALEMGVKATMAILGSCWNLRTQNWISKDCFYSFRIGILGPK